MKMRAAPVSLCAAIIVLTISFCLTGCVSTKACAAVPTEGDASTGSGVPSLDSSSGAEAGASSDGATAAGSPDGSTADSAAGSTDGKDSKTDGQDGEKKTPYVMPPKDTDTHADLSDEEFLKKLYDQAINKADDGKLYEKQLDALKKGASREEIMNEFYDSKDYKDSEELVRIANEKAPPRDLNTHPEMSDEEFVENMYKTILQRGSDEGGFKSHLDSLKNGASREDMINNVYNSLEYMRLIAYGRGDGKGDKKDGGDGKTDEKSDGKKGPGKGTADGASTGTSSTTNRHARPEIGPDGKVIINANDLAFFKSRFARLQDSFWKRLISGIGSNFVKDLWKPLENAVEKVN
jgi:hypothetical protein